MFCLFDGLFSILFDGVGLFLLIPASGICCVVLLVCVFCFIFSIPYAIWCV